MSEVVELSDAMAPTADDAVIPVPPSSTLGCPDPVLAAGARFYAEGNQHDITSLNPIAAVDVYGFKGLIQLAKLGSLALPSDSFFKEELYCPRWELPRRRATSAQLNKGR